MTKFTPISPQAHDNHRHVYQEQRTARAAMVLPVRDHLPTKVTERQSDKKVIKAYTNQHAIIIIASRSSDY